MEEGGSGEPLFLGGLLFLCWDMDVGGGCGGCGWECGLCACLLSLHFALWVPFASGCSAMQQRRNGQRLRPDYVLARVKASKASKGLVIDCHGRAEGQQKGDSRRADMVCLF